MPKYLVETVSMFRMRYVIECESEEHAMDEVTMGTDFEFSQRHIAENIISTMEVTDEQIKKLFIDDHPYLEGQEDRALSYVHKIEY